MEIKSNEKWTKGKFQKHIKTNIWTMDENGNTYGYGAAIIAGLLYKKLYGEIPKIGLSIFQWEAIEELLKVMPEVSEEEK